MPHLFRNYNDIRFVYHRIPKNAGSTITNLILQIDDIPIPSIENTEYGTTSVNNKKVTKTNGEVQHIPLIITKEFSREYSFVQANFIGLGGYIEPEPHDISLAISRNPIDRFISAYVNRIFFHRDLYKKPHSKNKETLDVYDWIINNLPKNPSIDCFIDNFEIYNKNYWIKKHFISQFACAGNPKNISHVYSIENILHAKELLEDISQKKLILRHLEKTSHILDIEISNKVKNYVYKQFQIDYDYGWA